jgi:hypothetical protein
MTTDVELHKSADAAKADLNKGVAEAVSRGDEAAPVRIDPMAARKAMFKKADALRNIEQANAKGDADPALIAALEAEARGEGAATQPDQAPTPPAKERATGQSQNEYVTITSEGGPISVAKADIDREGSVDLYLRRRQMDEAAAQDKIEIARLQRELADAKRLREPRQPSAADQDDPATIPARTTGRSHGSGASEQELAELASRLAQQIYSGDENDATTAILQILQRSQGRSLSAEDIERQVLSAVERVSTTPATPTATVPTNPRLEAINAQINAMSLSEYADVCANDIARNATFAYFKELIAKPENRDRRAVDVARDACDWGRAKFIGDPRSKVLERKRGLPSSTTASGATQTTTEDEQLTPAQVVEMMQNHRNFGRRIHN